jgi:phosphinothricin acetyltransferase
MVEPNPIIFREATLNELSFVLDLYNYHILHTTAIFDYETINMEELQARLSYNNKKYKTFLVCDASDKAMVGFCFLTQFRKKPAYDRTAEMGIYLKPENTGKKFGQLIIKFLEEYAKENQIEVMIATISGENVNSIAIKFNRRLDLVHYEKIL